MSDGIAALAGIVGAVNFSPVDQLVADAGQRLRDAEGRAFEKLVGVLYEERSRKRIGDFPLSERTNGWWDRSDTEIDLVALNATDRIIRLTQPPDTALHSQGERGGRAEAGLRTDLLCKKNAGVCTASCGANQWPCLAPASLQTGHTQKNRDFSAIFVRRSRVCKMSPAVYKLGKRSKPLP